jgi:hypothetical protein
LGGRCSISGFCGYVLYHHVSSVSDIRGTSSSPGRSRAAPIGAGWGWGAGRSYSGGWVDWVGRIRLWVCPCLGLVPCLSICPVPVPGNPTPVVVVLQVVWLLPAGAELLLAGCPEPFQHPAESSVWIFWSGIGRWMVERFGHRGSVEVGLGPELDWVGRTGCTG